MVDLLVALTFNYNLWRKLEISLLLIWKLGYMITNDTIVIEATFAVTDITCTSVPTDIINKVSFHPSKYFGEVKRKYISKYSSMSRSVLQPLTIFTKSSIMDA